MTLAKLPENNCSYCFQLIQNCICEKATVLHLGENPPDLVNHPPHYTNHPSGVECIQIIEYMNFCLGNALKYIWRAGEKGSKIEDLKKARWYIDREIMRLEELKGISQGVAGEK